ncbi:PD-(D/E)XK nuclease-like domain-containing protein [Ralstonia syzygii subsp. celebesensis]|uniref:Exonuclease VIII n=1 Tax=blood disease bacterium A2-HR MARDI TaxID=1944648 RepID=A0A1U9VQE5_9RALS|nr:PD-(D/E)XK nuclease-like domain-containing protein [Ralstonia syzygii]AQW32695.1 exonuclease VIII [blood disease bacterium A2-HR MARDI]QQV57723.1 PD-(D/E)XK nuclease-like domain-containing protein [Ralstonia syzygii subsp. celebesensis]
MSKFDIRNWIGLRYGESIENYHADKTAISKSGLDQIAQAPFIYYSRSLDPLRPPEPQKAGQLEGNLAHCATLEPDEFDKRYVVGPDVLRSTKVWKEFAKEHADRIAIKPDQYETAWRQGDSIRMLPQIREALKTGRAEVSARWIDPDTGVRCRCRPDWEHPTGSKTVKLLDVKTYSSAAAEEFKHQVARKAYHVQDAFYSDGFAIASGKKVEEFVFVVVETEWPFAAAAYTLGKDSREEGYFEYRRLLDIYERCLRNNVWPGYADKTTEIDMPPYAFNPQEVEFNYV